MGSIAYTSNSESVLTEAIPVYTVFVLDLIQTAFGTHAAWWFSIENWGNIASLQGAPWTSVVSPIMCGLSESHISTGRCGMLLKSAQYRQWCRYSMHCTCAHTSVRPCRSLSLTSRIGTFKTSIVPRLLAALIVLVCTPRNSGG